MFQVNQLLTVATRDEKVMPWGFDSRRGGVTSTYVEAETISLLLFSSGSSSLTRMYVGIQGVPYRYFRQKSKCYM